MAAIRRETGALSSERAKGASAAASRRSSRERLLSSVTSASGSALTRYTSPKSTKSGLRNVSAAFHEPKSTCGSRAGTRRRRQASS
eukprot:3889673-Lingulodinium_polyedra.AAC.1